MNTVWRKSCHSQKKRSLTKKSYHSQGKTITDQRKSGHAEKKSGYSQEKMITDQKKVVIHKKNGLWPKMSDHFKTKTDAMVFNQSFQFTYCIAVLADSASWAFFGWFHQSNNHLRLVWWNKNGRFVVTHCCWSQKASISFACSKSLIILWFFLFQTCLQCYINWFTAPFKFDLASCIECWSILM